MALYKKYSGEFLGRNNIKWRADIFVQADAQGEVEELTFPAESPLSFDWEEKSKEEVMCGSSCTLVVESPGDRTYEGLYTIKVGTVRLDVYRNDVLYWSGCLDPEFYEEPYISNSLYDVSLTFSDFGILDRMPYALSGLQNLKSIVEHGLRRSGINTLGTEYLISTMINDTVLDLSALSVMSENFFDEDGEAKTLYEAIEAILQPLALKMIQKNGKIYIYDLNSLYNQSTSKEVYWTDEDQMLGVDKVANNVKVTFSPYAKASLLSDEVEFGAEYDESMIGRYGSGTDPYYYSYQEDYVNGNRASANWNDYVSFTIFTSESGSGIAAKGAGTKYFHILPLLGGEESDGVAWMYYTGGHGSLASGLPERKLNAITKDTGGDLVLRSKRTPIPVINASDKKKFLLRIKQEMLLDTRYNPFTQASGDNEKGNHERWKVRSGYVMIPCSVTLYDEAGIALMHYENYDSTAPYCRKRWVDGAATYGTCFLSYYDKSDRAENSGVLGWKTNLQYIGLSTADINESSKVYDGGESIPYPSQGGYLEVCIYSGVRVYDYKGDKEDWDNMTQAIKYKLWDMIRWLLYKAPQIDIIRNTTKRSDVESDDVEYSGLINADAKDDIEIDTICGTIDKIIPSSRGSYYFTSSGLQAQELTRAGRTTQAEQLLIGTLYSQFAERRTKLTGTCKLPAYPLTTFTDQCQEGKKFMCAGESQDAICNESEITLIELRPDEYISDTD